MTTLGPYDCLLYDDEDRKFQEQVRKFTREVILPEAIKIEKTNEYRRDLIKKIGEEGYMGVHHPREYGGSDDGKGCLRETIVSEEISAVSPGLDMCRMASATLYGAPVRIFSTEEQKKKFLEPIIKGEKIGAIGITEPGVGSDTAGMKTRATRTEGGWLLNGEKRYITNGSQADYICAFAITDTSVDSKKGMSAFIVDTTSDKFERVKDYDLMGMRGAKVSHFRLNEVFVPDDAVLGQIGQGFRILMEELDFERVSIAGEALGYMHVPYQAAIRHSNTRVQFGRLIRRFEGVSFKIAEMSMLMNASRLLTAQAANLIDRGEKSTKHATICKVYATEAAVKIADMAIQILGGDGYNKENRVEQFYRDARLMLVGGGTAEILRFLIQREVYKEHGM
ncbi:MAG: acyl-CoA dehydrogenase family protein [Candidatus Hodarchaeales archaeon]|jgi:alkylation response protein AidB-like acyl-CoA dehydrogenase